MATRRGAAPSATAASLPQAAVPGAPPAAATAEATSSQSSGYGLRERVGRHVDAMDEDDDDYDDEGRAAVTPSAAPAAASALATTSATSRDSRTVKDLKELIQRKNAEYPNGLGWACSNKTRDELLEIVAKIEAGQAPPARSKRGRPASTAPSQAAVTTAQGQTGPLSRVARAVVVTSDPRVLTEKEASAAFIDADAREQVLEFTRRAATVYTRGASLTAKTAAMHDRVAQPTLDLLKTRANERLERDINDVEMRQFVGTLYVLLRFNGSLPECFEVMRRAYASESIEFMEAKRFGEVLRAISLVSHDDTSLGSRGVHPSLNAKAYQRADAALFDGLTWLFSGIPGLHVTVDDDVIKTASDMAALLGAYELTPRKGEGISTSVVAWPIAGMPVAYKHVEPVHAGDDPLAYDAQTIALLDLVLGFRSERGMFCYADRGYTSSRLVRHFFALGAYLLGPARERLRDGVPLQRVLFRLLAAMIARAPAAVPSVAAPLAGPAADSALPVVGSAADSALPVVGSAADAAPATGGGAVPAPHALRPTGTFVGSVAGAVPVLSGTVLPRRLELGGAGEIRVAISDETGDMTIAAISEERAGVCSGALLSTEHGSRHSSSAFTTPMFYSMTKALLVALVNTYVRIPKNTPPHVDAVFSVEEFQKSKQKKALRLIRATLIAQEAVTPATEFDCTLEWFEFRHFTVSGTAAVTLLADFIAELERELGQLGRGEEIGVGAPAEDVLRTLLLLIKREGADLASLVRETNVEEDAAMDARVQGTQLGEAIGPGRSIGEGDDDGDESDAPLGGAAEDDDDEPLAPDPDSAQSATTPVPVTTPAAGAGVGPAQAQGPAAPALAQLSDPARIFLGLVKVWFRRTFSSRYMRWGKSNEGRIRADLARLACRRAQGLVGLGESRHVPGLSATPDGCATEAVLLPGAAEPVECLVLDEIKSHFASSALDKAREVRGEFPLDPSQPRATALDISSPQARRAVPSLAHVVQILVQQAVWGVPLTRYSVCSARGIIYSVVLYTTPSVLEALRFVIGRVLAEPLAAFRPLYERGASIDAPDVIEHIMTALHNRFGHEVSSEVLDLVASHLPRVVGLRRLMGRGDKANFPMVPVHVLKNAAPWLYNGGKPGVDRTTQRVQELMNKVKDPISRVGGFECLAAVRRVFTILCAAQQAVRVTEAVPSAVHNWSYMTFRNNMSKQGNAVDGAVDLGLFLLTKPTSLTGAPAPSLPASGLLSTLSASTSSARAALDLRDAIARGAETPASGASSVAGSVSSSLASRLVQPVDATPVTMVRLQFADLVKAGFLKSGVEHDDPRLLQLTVDESRTILDLVVNLARRKRAARLVLFDEGGLYDEVRRTDFLNHEIITFDEERALYASFYGSGGHESEDESENEDEDEEGGGEGQSAAGTEHTSAADSTSAPGNSANKRSARCKMCASKGSSHRATGKCRVCRVTLCVAHFQAFHTNANVSGKKGKKSARLDFTGQ